MGPVAARLFPLPFFLFGAVCLYVGVKLLDTASSSKAWPTTAGEVVSATLASRRGEQGGVIYHAEILYRYTVNGQTRTSNQVSFGSYGSNRPAHAQGVLNQYPVGSTVTVYHSPTDPDKAVLQPGTAWFTWVLPAFGLVFLSAGLAGWYFLPRKAGALSRRSG